MTYRLLFLCLLLSNTSLYAAVSPSFNCAKASTQVEKQICQSDAVAALDVKLATRYKALKKSHAQIIKASQKKWFKQRNKRCERIADEKRESCLAHSYGTQIAELNLITQQDNKKVMTAICHDIAQPYYDTGITLNIIEGGVFTLTCLEGVLDSLGRHKIDTDNWSKLVQEAGNAVGALHQTMNTQRKSCEGHCGTLSNVMHYDTMVNFYDNVITEMYLFDN